MAGLRRELRTIAWTAVLGLGLVACAGGTRDVGPTAGVTTTAPCPPSPARPAGGGPPAGQPGAGPGLPVSTTVAPSDTSTSVVIAADGPQMQCTTAEVTRHTDVVYARPTVGAAPIELRMDVLAPATPGPKPLVVYLPGGGFMISPKEAALDQRTYVAQAGYVVASIQYRTVVNGAIYRDAVADVKAAIRHLRANAATYGIDPAKVGVWGESAGGYLAAMVGTTAGLDRFEEGADLDQSSAVQAVVDKFGASDLSKIASDFDAASQQAYNAPNSSLASFVYGPGSGKAIGADPAAVAAADPITSVDGTDPAFLLFHGSVDKLVSPSQTLMLHEALRAKGVDSTRYVLTDVGHGDLAVPGDPKGAASWTTRQVMDTIVGFLDKNLR